MELPVTIRNVVFANDSYSVLGAELDVCNDKYKPEMEDYIKECINPKYNSFVITTNMMGSGENPAGGQYVCIGEIVVDKKSRKSNLLSQTLNNFQQRYGCLVLEGILGPPQRLRSGTIMLEASAYSIDIEATIMPV